jgi:hypothetical protein
MIEGFREDVCMGRRNYIQAPPEGTRKKWTGVGGGHMTVEEEAQL